MNNEAVTISQMNTMKVGETQTLSFTGSATHGGGSCQLSITLDKIPTKDSKFKVVYSIEGGCPQGQTAENSPPSEFPFTIPKEVPNGEATFAWTWFNRIGNREMYLTPTLSLLQKQNFYLANLSPRYMNCAPVTIEGGASDHSEFDKLPDMAIATLKLNNCNTTEGSNYL